MVWQAHSLLCPQELNQGISSLDSFPFSHNNFRSHPSPIARILRALSDQRLSSRPGSGSFVPLQRTSLLEAPFPSLATGPLFRTRVKRKGEWGWGDSLCPTASNGAAGDRQKRANGVRGSSGGGGQNSNEKMHWRLRGPSGQPAQPAPASSPTCEGKKEGRI